MRKIRYTYPALITALVALVSLAAGIIVSLTTQNFILLYTSLGLVVASIMGGVFVIVETAQEKRTNKPDNDKVTTVTKDIAGRFILREGPVTIEVPDAESAIKMLQVIFNGKSSLKVESGLTIEVKEPEEERDAPETKGDEE